MADQREKAKKVGVIAERLEQRMPNGGPDNCMNCEHSGMGDLDSKTIRVTCSIRAATIVLPPHTYCRNFTSQERNVSGGETPLGPIWVDVSHENLPSALYPPDKIISTRCPVPDWGKYHLVMGSSNEDLLKKFLNGQVEKYENEEWEKKNPGKVRDDFRETLVRLVDKLFLEAVNHQADEIHFEPGEVEAGVEISTKSGSQKLRSIPMSFYEDILFLIKARANMDTESLLTQNGVFYIRVEDKFFEASATTQTLSNGEIIKIKLEETDPEEEENSSEDPDQSHKWV